MCTFKEGFQIIRLCDLGIPIPKYFCKLATCHFIGMKRIKEQILTGIFTYFILFYPSYPSTTVNPPKWTTTTTCNLSFLKPFMSN